MCWFTFWGGLLYFLGHEKSGSVHTNVLITTTILLVFANCTFLLIFLFFSGIGCNAGQYSNSETELYKGSTSCEICPSGFSSSARQYECTICATGQITNV